MQNQNSAENDIPIFVDTEIKVQEPPVDSAISGVQPKFSTRMSLGGIESGTLLIDGVDISKSAEWPPYFAEDDGEPLPEIEVERLRRRSTLTTESASRKSSLSPNRKISLGSIQPGRLLIDGVDISKSAEWPPYFAEDDGEPLSEIEVERLKRLSISQEPSISINQPITITSTLTEEPAEEVGTTIQVAVSIEEPVQVESSPLPINEWSIPRSNTAIFNEKREKPYFGGYRNKKTGAIYHHAFTQTATAWDQRALNAPEKFHRDAQTKFVHNRVTQSNKDVAIQLEQPGFFVDKRTDRKKRAKRYVSAQQVLDNYTSKIVTIQSVARRWLAARRVQRIIATRRAILKEKKEREELKIKTEKEQQERDVERRLHPRNVQDFQLLYNAIEEWRRDKVEKIILQGHDPEEKTRLFSEMLDQETEMIQRIDRLRVQANRENKSDKRLQIVEKMAQAQMWPAHAQTFSSVIVDTPDIVRARELSDIYHKIVDYSVSVDERLGNLLELKDIVKEFDCKLSREIISLLEREADLLNRNRSDASLQGLRQRIANLFYHFTRVPEFNPASKQFTKNPLHKKIEQIYFCKGCSLYLPASDFNISSDSSQLGRCRKCLEEEKISNARLLDEVFSSMIKQLQQSESLFEQDTRVLKLRFVDIVREYDLRHLVYSIWGCKSSISGISDIQRLTFVRWDKNEPLTPWNCLMCTFEERKDHLSCQEPLGFYSSEFIRSLAQKHKTAKTYFSRLAHYADIFSH